MPWSQTFTWHKHQWLEGNTPIVGPRTHAFWLGSSVFDGARHFDGVTPDLDLHCARVNQSAQALHLKPVMQPGAIVELAHEGIAKFAPGTALYVRPMYWAEEGGPGTSIPPLYDSTQFLLCIYAAPMPEPTGVSITRSPYRRPTVECAPVNAKAGCLYPNNARAILEAKARGFDNALVLDMLGNVAELGTANVFMAKDGRVLTPAANGTFLPGITRARTMALLRKAGVEVLEATLGVQDFCDADEIFYTGNFAKVMPVTRIETRALQPGPFYLRARALYLAFAHGDA